MQEEIRPERVSVNIIYLGALSRALYAAAELGIADLLAERPCSLSQLASLTATQERPLASFMALLTSYDFFRKDAAGHFQLGERGALLRADAFGNSLRMDSPAVWGGLSEVIHTLKTGEPAFDKTHGLSLYQYLDEHAEEATVLHQGMAAVYSEDVAHVLAGYDFTPCQQVVDVGGGQGELLASIVERYPHLRGILYEAPANAEQARYLLASPAHGRCQAIAGDFFQSVPAGGDCYLLKRVLHDWPEAQAIQILRNCRAAMSPQGKVLVIDYLSPEQCDATTQDITALNVLLSCYNRGMYAEADYQRLYQAAGLTLARIVSLEGDLRIIEGIPA